MANGKLRSIAQAVIVTAEVMGHELSPRAGEAMALELAAYPPVGVHNALRRCTRELSGKLTLAAIVQRIDDGHPSREEAWSMCQAARDEARTLVWTDEMSEAFGAARPLLIEGDAVAARMAFLACYDRLLRESRDQKRTARWAASLGHDPDDRAAVLTAASASGRLESGYVAGLLPPGDFRLPIEIEKLLEPLTNGAKT